MSLPEPYVNPKYEGLSLQEMLDLDPRLILLTGLGVHPADLTDADIQKLFDGKPLARDVVPNTGGKTVAQG